MSPLVNAALPEFCRGLLQVGLGLLIQSSILIVAGLLIAAALRRHGPAVASAIYRATLASVVLTPLLSLGSFGAITPLWRIHLPATPARAIRAPADRAPVARVTVAPASPVARNGRSTVPVARDWNVARSSVTTMPERAWVPAAIGRAAHPERACVFAALYVAATGVWGMGAALLLAWLALCHFQILRLRANGTPVREGETAAMLRSLCATLRLRAPALLAGPGVRSPFLAGLRRPAILLPASHEADFDPAALRAILAHELTHLARGDCGWNLIGRVACAVGWLQPLLWLLRRRMEQASEEVCDQAVIQQHCPPRAYAHCLVEMAERFLLSSSQRALGTGVVSHRSSLARRVRQIIAGPRFRSLALSSPLRATITLCTLAGAVGGVFLISGAAGPPSARAAPLFSLAPALEADQKGDALLKQLVATTRATQGMSADLMVRERSGAHTWIWRGEVALKRPNLAQVHLEHKPLPRLRGSVVRLISDGKRVYWWETPLHKEVRTWPADPRGGNIDPLYGAFPVLFFYGQLDSLFGPNAPITSRYVGQKKVDGKRFEVVDVTDRRETSRTIRFYIGPDNLLHRTVSMVKRDEEEHTYEGILTKIQKGKRLPATYFRFRLPEGMTLRREPTDQEREDALIPVGTPVPQFTLPQPTGGTLALSDARKNRKAILINFWYYG